MTRSLESRLEILELHLRTEERKERLWRRAAVGSWLLLAGLLAAGSAGPQALEVVEVEHVRARLLEVVDGSGRVIARIGPDGEGRGEVSVRSDSGDIAAFLGATGQGHGAVVTKNAAGALIGFFGGSPEGDGGLWLSWGNGEQIQYVGADVRGNGCVPADVKPGRRL